MNQKLKIFVVDNDQIYLTITQKLLSKISDAFSVSIFYDGIQAFEVLKNLIDSKSNDLPDIILLDLDMPIMDGWEFLENYKKMGINNYKSIPIYIVTSSIALEDVSKSDSYQEVLGYLVKPLNIETLKNILTN
ncbi:response regulator [Flavobacterium orientale]|uniref:Response regulator n=1 Tax=Flavobacterium orientale TaxID=1756020 RepID=A0A916XXG0_9FLAO|nr:response regulator [Flavobacterium orientale]GGD19398.1 response regulator [Flavobacterium orientale]